jgi:hypothetical protein
MLLWRLEAIALVIVLVRVDSHDERLVENQDNVNEPDFSPGDPLDVVVVVDESGDLFQTDAQHLLEHNQSNV